MNFLKTKLKENLIDLLIEILKNGKIPHHVAFICDGNRRFSKANKISHKESYLRGKQSFNYIKKVFEKIGVKEISFFVFGIENFKRPESEKAILFDLLREEVEQNEEKK